MKLFSFFKIVTSRQMKWYDCERFRLGPADLSKKSRYLFNREFRLNAARWSSRRRVPLKSPITQLVIRMVRSPRGSTLLRHKKQGLVSKPAGVWDKIRSEAAESRPRIVIWINVLFSHYLLLLPRWQFFFSNGSSILPFANIKDSTLRNSSFYLLFYFSLFG